MIPGKTAMPWREFRHLNLIDINAYSMLVPQTIDPFVSLILATAYSQKGGYPGIHVFFASKFPETKEFLFRGFIPCYLSGENPDYGPAQRLTWTALAEVRKSEKSKGEMPILELHQVIINTVDVESGESLYQITPQHDVDIVKLMHWAEERHKIIPDCPLQRVRSKLIKAYDKLQSGAP